MRESCYVILSYKIRHDYDVKRFLESYRLLLQRAVDIIWENVEWVEKRQRNYYVVRRGRRVRNDRACWRNICKTIN